MSSLFLVVLEDSTLNKDNNARSSVLEKLKQEKMPFFSISENSIVTKHEGVTGEVKKLLGIDEGAMLPG